MKDSNINYRFQFIDALRGLTIILMIFFHLSFDLSHFGMIQIDILHGHFWYLLPRVIVFLFLFAVGMSLRIAHFPKVIFFDFSKRLLKLIFFALTISAVTYFLFPDNWIYFGTLHAIALISVLSLPFLHYPKLAFSIALVLFVPSIFWNYNLPWFSLPHQSWDYIAPFPWLGASLFGIFASHNDLQLLDLGNNPFTKLLSYLGKRSLFIYLLHQPLLFGLTALISRYFNH